MKAIMYHYVRPTPADLPFSRYLHIDDFRKQLDFFAADEGFVTREDFLAVFDGGPIPDKGVVLTFDDAIDDHYRHVLPELRLRGLWGLFYVPTGMYAGGGMLDVHRVHYLLGRHGGMAMLAELEAMVEPRMLRSDHVAEFQHKTYRSQTNDEATTEFKRMLNYFVDIEWRDRLLDRLMERFADAEVVSRDWYMSSRDIRDMQHAGMIIGSHSISHPVFSRLPVADQEREIVGSFAYLEDVTGGLAVRTFCYPHGGFHTFTADTERLLDEHRCRFSFNVEPRDISRDDIHHRPQALPRYNCNMFPHGKARFGADESMDA
ncbi:MAG: polysaccharide deacetylase family protein [Alphaproteobacteria bacterium]|nr:polysaccharide deacetylase family protein [Alphaproteobacteria bacterium]